ncbi:MAG: phosphoribosylanthranilate isomerase [Kiritimatiellae bacterium]|nr:phosphoribosylanthranilate isomerase [Kiritimatiellia bacterium]
MPRLKICGITDGDFAVEAERLGADYLGFVLAEGSPRRVSAVQVRAIVSRLAGKARKVGVYTRFPDLNEAKSLGFDVIQLHFKATPEEVGKVREAGFECWDLAGGAEADALLFDSSHGDGETRLRTVACRRILAGKISPENLAQACASGVDIVDVNSSLETEPGVKSLARLRQLFSALPG